MFIMLCTAFPKQSPTAADPAVFHRRADLAFNMCFLGVCLLLGYLTIRIRFVCMIDMSSALSDGTADSSV
jgi:hypothetical protein